MSSILDLSVLANAAYETNPNRVNGWICTAFRAGSGHLNGFQAAAFTKGGETVLAFRGTTGSVDDVTSDLKLGMGMNTGHFGAADAFAAEYATVKNVSVTGHSLGGAIAQVVANRQGFKFATFNAPGVAVFASRNMSDAQPLALGMRAMGSVLSAIRHPVQAARDIASTFTVVKGVNVCLQGDLVSRIGIHYGNVLRIPGSSANPLTEHGIGTVISVLGANPVGGLTIDQLG